MKAKKRPMVINEVGYADSNDDSRNRLMEVYRLLLHQSVRDASERKQLELKKSQKEVKMEENTTEQGHPEPEQLVSETPRGDTTLEAEQPTEPKMPGADISSETPEAETKKVQELAGQVKICLMGSGSCEGIGSKLDDAARELGIEVSALIEQIFEIISPGEG